VKEVIIFMKQCDLLSCCVELLKNNLKIRLHVTENYYFKEVAQADAVIADGKLGGAGLIHEHKSCNKNLVSLLLIERTDDLWIAKWSGATLAVMQPLSLDDMEEALNRIKLI
jgi:hypothetical protein